MGLQSLCIRQYPNAAAKPRTYPVFQKTFAGGAYITVEPGYSEVHKSDRSFHYSYYFTIARVKYMCVVETVRLVASV